MLPPHDPLLLDVRTVSFLFHDDIRVSISSPLPFLPLLLKLRSRLPSSSLNKQDSRGTTFQLPSYFLRILVGSLLLLRNPYLSPVLPSLSSLALYASPPQLERLHDERILPLHLPFLRSSRIAADLLRRTSLPAGRRMGSIEWVGRKRWGDDDVERRAELRAAAGLVRLGNVLSEGIEEGDIYIIA